MSETQTAMNEEPPMKRFYVTTDSGGMVVHCSSSNMEIPEMIEVSSETFDRIMSTPGPLKYVDGALSEIALAPLPPVIPTVVTDYQFAGQANAEGIISFEEAMAWTARGDIPSVLLAAVNEAVTDEDRRKAVLLFLAGSKEYPRNHPLTPVLGSLLGKTDDAALDAFWIAAAAR